MEVEVIYMVHHRHMPDVLDLPMLPRRPATIRFLRLRNELHVADLSSCRMAR
jgi:hypothetical protein